MLTDRMLLTNIAAVLLAIVAAGLLVRGRVGLCCAFFIEVLVALTTNRLQAHWPERFFVFTFYAVKETVLAVLTIVVGLEVWRKSFSRFPKARVRVGILIASALLATAVAAAMVPEDLSRYKALVTILVPRLNSGTLCVLTMVVAAATWYRIPLHPLHRAVLMGHAVVLSGQVLLLSMLGWSSDPNSVLETLSDLNRLVFLGACSWWAWAAWRPSTPPTPILARLQPWAHSW